jgi:nucleoside-diphosphate-sugar epimerase
MSLTEKIQEEVLKLQGPIVIFGAGGFIGANLFRQIAQYREDVFAVTSKPFIPWRLDDCDHKKILHCNITKKSDIELLFEEHQFKTIFTLAAYGAYSKQDDIDLIHETNYIGLLNLLGIIF